MASTHRQALLRRAGVSWLLLATGLVVSLTGENGWGATLTLLGMVGSLLCLHQLGRGGVEPPP